MLEHVVEKSSPRGELTKKQATDALDQLMRAPIQLAALRDLVAGAHRLALEIDHPSYDCLYLALADRERDERFLKERGGQATKRLNTSAPLVPPKPKEFDKA